MTIMEKTAYLKGLADGQGVTGEKIEGKVTLALIDLIGDLAREHETLKLKVGTLDKKATGLAEDLESLEEIVFGFNADDGDDEDDCDDCDCDCCADDDDDDELEYETECPKCGEEITIDEDDLIVGYAVCPKCGEKWEFEFIDADESEDDADGGE